MKTKSSIAEFPSIFSFSCLDICKVYTFNINTNYVLLLNINSIIWHLRILLINFIDFLDCLTPSMASCTVNCILM